MKWLTDFWKMRRQSGSVKIAILLFLFALYFIVQSVIAVVGYAEFVNQKVEYIITVSDPNGVQSSDISKLKSLDNVAYISPQRLYSITYKSDTDLESLSVTEVYADYLHSAYDIDSAISGKSFYLNKSAWNEIMPDDTSESTRMAYTENETSEKTAQFIFTDTLSDASPMAYSAGNSITLNGCTSIRVMFSKTDITGKTLEAIRTLGYSIENEQEILDGVHELEIVMLKLKYGVIIAVLSISFGYALVKEQYKKRHHT